MQGGSREVFNWGPGLGGDTARGRARREKQDEYRKALDAQIEERRARDRTRRGSSNPTSQPVPDKAVSDPVGHLMHWTNKDGVPKGPCQNTQKSQTSNQPQPHLQQYQQQQPQQHQYSYPRGTPDGSSFYGAPLPPPPAAYQGQPPPVMQQPPQPNPPPNYPAAQHLYQNQFHPQQNVAYGYYPSSQPIAIPPPPQNYATSPYQAYGSPPQMPPQQFHPQQHTHQQQQHTHQQQHQQLQQFLQTIPPPPGSYRAESHDTPQNPPAVEKVPEKDSTPAAKDAENKPYASQGYEDAATVQENEKASLEEYRRTLEQQLEQKRKIEEERLANEKKLDEMLRKRDEMILKREKEGIEMEKRRIIEKEAERLRKAEEAAKAIEEQMKEAKRLKEAKVEAKRKEVEEMLANLPTPEERNSPPQSISKRADVVYDNTPVPALMNRKSTELEGKGIDMGGSGDNNMSIIGTFQSNNNNADNRGSSIAAGFGTHHRKKYVEDAGQVGQEEIQYMKPPLEISNYSAPAAREPIKESPQTITAEPPKIIRGSETYRRRNAHTSIIGPNGQVQDNYMYVPTSPVHMHRYKHKGQPTSANDLLGATTPARQAASSSSLPAHNGCRKCPNCKHAFSGNLMIETKDESTETEPSEPFIPQKYPNRQLQDQDREFLAKLHDFFEEESAHVKQEMHITDEEIFECDNNMIPKLTFDNNYVTESDSELTTRRVYETDSQSD